jgi:hypothetical protein
MESQQAEAKAFYTFCLCPQMSLPGEEEEEEGQAQMSVRKQKQTSIDATSIEHESLLPCSVALGPFWVLPGGLQFPESRGLPLQGP